MHELLCHYIHKVYQANRKIVTENETLQGALQLILQELNFYPFHIFFVFFAKKS